MNQSSNSNKMQGKIKITISNNNNEMPTKGDSRQLQIPRNYLLLFHSYGEICLQVWKDLLHLAYQFN
jgi:hypothetical protein